MTINDPFPCKYTNSIITHYVDAILSIMHMYRGEGIPVGIDKFMMANTVTKQLYLELIHDSVVRAGYTWDLNGICEAGNNGVISEEDVIRVIVNVGLFELQYL